MSFTDMPLDDLDTIPAPPPDPSVLDYRDLHALSVEAGCTIDSLGRCHLCDEPCPPTRRTGEREG
jgi:hypothetical protein